MKANGKARVVLVHDWLTGMRGGEKCLEVLCRHWPDAPLFTLLHKRGTVVPIIENRPIHSSFFRFLPKVDRYYRYLLPIMPLAAKWSLPPCDVVVSLSHCAAKAACPPPATPHLCYCFTPMRYAWHMRDAYFANDRVSPKTWLREKLLARLREWDRRTADGVTQFIAISRAVQRRIKECYGRDSQVIYPPVDTDFYTPTEELREDFYLAVSAFAPYKRIDLAIKACEQLRRQLVVIGSGQETKRLRELSGPNVRFLGWQPDEVVRDYMRRCRALLFPGEEEFGIAPVEAQACGTPVIALGRGGATETLVTGRHPTGVLFKEQSVECLQEAIISFENEVDGFAPEDARRNALRFQQCRFAGEMIDLIERAAGNRDFATNVKRERRRTPEEVSVAAED